MSSKKSVPLISMAVLCGALLSLAFVNPHNGKITLAELVLQLSGSRGDLPLGTSLPELLSFSIKMAPYFLFELYIGVSEGKQITIQFNYADELASYQQMIAAAAKEVG